jgi:hypothetical protein
MGVGDVRHDDDLCPRGGVVMAVRDEHVLAHDACRKVFDANGDDVHVLASVGPHAELGQGVV